MGILHCYVSCFALFACFYTILGGKTAPHIFSNHAWNLDTTRNCGGMGPSRGMGNLTSHDADAKKSKTYSPEMVVKDGDASKKYITLRIMDPPMEGFEPI